MISIVRHCNDREKFSNWMSDIFYLIRCKFWMLSRLLSICSVGIFNKANNLALHTEWGEKINWKKIYFHWWWSTHASCLNKKKSGFCFCFFPLIGQDSLIWKSPCTCSGREAERGSENLHTEVSLEPWSTTWLRTHHSTMLPASELHKIACLFPYTTATYGISRPHY